MAIQEAFGWDGDHLYAFYMTNDMEDWLNEYAGDPIGGDLPPSPFGFDPKSAARAQLRDFDLKTGMQFKYRFDFGDELHHSVDVLDVGVVPEKGGRYPRMVEKTGRAPSQYRRADYEDDYDEEPGDGDDEDEVEDKEDESDEP
jgi:hypothetical protein